jgi:hypothetical protein
VTAKIKIEVKVKINVNGDGQECPSHTSKIKGNFNGVPRLFWPWFRNRLLQLP